MKRTLLLFGLLAGSLSASGQWLSRPIQFARPSNFNLIISAIDANVAWTTVVEENAVLTGRSRWFARTTDGGQNWLLREVMSPAEFITDFQALDANTAWAALASSTGTPGVNGKHLLKTTDGGQTWWRGSNLSQFVSTSSFPTYVRFFNATEGVTIGETVGGRFEIYTTSNGGGTWVTVPAGNIPAAQSGEIIYRGRPRIALAGTSVWFTTNLGRVFYSANAGQNWAVSDPGLFPDDVQAMAFRDARNGLIVCSAGSLLRTGDGGVSWTFVQPTGAYRGVGLDAVPGTRTYVATGFASLSTSPGSGAGSSYSTDDGQTWTPLETNLNHALVDFVSPTVGWSAALTVDTSGFIVGGTGMNKYSGPALATARLQTLAVQVMPNPSADGQFRLHLPAGPAAELRVHDALGRLLLTRQLPASPGAPVTLDLSPYRAGVYTLDVRSAAGEARHKLVIQ
ncbi:T9SS type A sorting domain-containing protein [Hymenobacter gummosus]|uniref:T9SS type A sorting domain-containing protein n=1 Tax=Hymenobacter gummosus TaxID=1776032 RepID=A0A431U6H7_9BACT|nr:YCF48-related protein [Hymenobacter gummosus]RTQ52278.1 T9SS type A sorting domain-containing protein [Hymenobacter gummosus]